VAVQASAQTLLVEEVSNETDAATEHEEAVEDTDGHVLFGFFGCESTTVAEEIDEAHSNAAVDIEDEVVLLRGCDSLNSKGIVKHLRAWEGLLDVLLDKFDTEIRVVSRLDTVTDTRN